MKNCNYILPSTHGIEACKNCSNYTNMFNNKDNIVLKFKPKFTKVEIDIDYLNKLEEENKRLKNLMRDFYKIDIGEYKGSIK